MPEVYWSNDVADYAKPTISVMHHLLHEAAVAVQGFWCYWSIKRPTGHQPYYGSQEDNDLSVTG